MNKKYFFIIISSLLLSGCNNKTPSNVEFTLTDLGQNVEFHTELQLKYIDSEDYLTTMGIASGSSEKSAPNAVNISWKAKPINGKKTKKYVLDLYEGNNEESKWTYEVSDTEVDIYNLKINTTYSYKVTAVYSDKSFTSEASVFKTTSKAPRNLYVENVMNFRDLGGNGIKQGLIYRSGRFNEDDGASLLTEATQKQMKEQFGFKTEVDLRRMDEYGNITASPLGSDVNYIHLPLYYGGQNILVYHGEHSGVDYDNPARIKDFFDLLANPNSYPLDFHCAIGKDRTGCMAYLIKALCGVEEEHLYRDYLFSNFAKISGMCNVSDIDDRYGQTLKDYTGDSLQEKTYNYLHEVIGVSEDNLNSIRNILIEE